MKPNQYLALLQEAGFILTCKKTAAKPKKQLSSNTTNHSNYIAGNNMSDKTTHNKEFMKFIASSVFILFLVGMLLFLTYVPVPTENRDLIVAIVSTFMGGAAVAMGRLFGDSDTENEKLKNQVEKLEVKYDVLKGEYDKIVEMLVERHLVKKEGIE